MDKHKNFVISSLCVGDIKFLKDTDGNQLFSDEELESITEEDMKNISSRLANDYHEQLFWSSLQKKVDRILMLKKSQTNETS